MPLATNTPTRHPACPQINFLALLAANLGIPNPDVIFPGTTLKLPCPPKIMCRAAVSVKEGDSILNISQRYSPPIPLQDMLNANLNIVNRDLIFPGDVVFVPPCTQTPDLLAASAVKPARASCVSQTYVAKKGDRPGTVAAMFNMQIGDLFRLNPKLRKFKTRLIKARQSLNVLSCPKAVRLSYTSAQVCKSFYTVQLGDTAVTAAAKVGTTVTKLMVGNGFITSITRPLQVGRKLCIVP